MYLIEGCNCFLENVGNVLDLRVQCYPVTDLCNKENENEKKMF